MEEKILAFWIMGVEGIGARTIQKLCDYFGDLESIYRANERQLENVQGMTEKRIQKLVQSRNRNQILFRYESMQKMGIQFCYQGEEAYPKKLYTLHDAPFGLFFKGQLPDEQKKAVAIVGARKASYEGLETARKLGRELAENGVQVISGLAAGIDVDAHRGALSVAGGQTFGVLGCGVDICYPNCNRKEYECIPKYGGVISEFVPGVSPLARNFPMRNRIISGLSDGVLVIEARKKSGSLITAELGLEQGKDIFVVPGSIHDALYEGSNALLKEGAALVTNGKDILDALGIFYDEDVTERKKKCISNLESLEKIVYASLSLEPIHVSSIAETVKMPVCQIIESLTKLEEKGLIRMVWNNYYAVTLK